MNSDDTQPRSVYRDTNAVPRNPDDTTLHLAVKEGEVAPRIVTVGCPGRAARIAQSLDPARPVFLKVSPRGFETYTGTFEGTPVSIVSIGMGLAMMDFFVREIRQVVAGEALLVVRFGTCGVLKADVPVGGVVVASPGSVLVMRNPDAFLLAPGENGNGDKDRHGGGGGGGGAAPPPYLVFQPQLADPGLSHALVQALGAELGPTAVAKGMNASACSFYSSQGRQDPLFEDRNAGVLDQLRAQHPSVVSMEMETFQLFALANASRGAIRAAAASIGVANRPTGDVCTEEVLTHLESAGGKAVLQSLVRVPLG